MKITSLEILLQPNTSCSCAIQRFGWFR